ncbi:hypothetical protein L6475_02025 [Prevotella sp. E9-3]|uniref:hypothetical protein n=1 Tax=Prevotella sp. E9-3 TaxID=2913621 RepID=UPI001EDAD144|nr:hypothetical protein [Prevotella sp. E9-3]UKK48772.1 hypothetical protein L6475_02025 [Prevotella sp. E9-3]
MIKDQFVEDSTAQHVDAAAGDAAVGVESYLSALADDGPCQQVQQEGGAVFLILANEGDVGRHQVAQQHEEGRAHTGCRVGVGYMLVAYTLEEPFHIVCRVCHAAVFMQIYPVGKEVENTCQKLAST